MRPALAAAPLRYPQTGAIRGQGDRWALIGRTARRRIDIARQEPGK